jgi:pimeloyl-ACP methyl ester carboxylesterase
MLYWVTQSYHTSARYYYEAAHNPWQPLTDTLPVVTTPTALAVFPAELTHPARKWAERYYNLQQWTAMSSGGHFAPMEEPEALVEDLRRFFRGRR